MVTWPGSTVLLSQVIDAMWLFFDLCSGEFVEPKEYFRISEYPSFLKSSTTCSSVGMTSQPSLFSQAAPSNMSAAVSFPVHTQTGESQVDLICTEPSEMDTGTSTVSETTSVVGGVKSAQGGVTTVVGAVNSTVSGVTSAFSTVDSSKELVTPNLYGPPAVGKAVASSTPAAARSLKFTGSDGVQQYHPSLSVGVDDKGKPEQS